MFSQKDLKYISQKGISLDTLTTQIRNFQKGFPFMDITKPATINDGILRLNEQQIERCIANFDEKSKHHQICKFVPASGAASRMFKDLFAAYQDNPPNIQKHSAALHFVNQLEHFAFYAELKKVLAKNGYDLEDLKKSKNYAPIFEYLLTEKGLDYGNLPKGLLQFHLYTPNNIRTPFEEHLVEGAAYSRNEDGTVYLHFTVSPEHRSRFEALLKSVREKYEQHFGVRFEVEFSEQYSHTDTIAVDMGNAPFREKNGQILFRPGGHGALIENLNELNDTVDIVFIKNIDNVVPDNLKDTTFTYKKVIGGVLMAYQEKIFDFLQELEVQKTNESLIEEATLFLQNELCAVLPKGFQDLNTSEKADFLFHKLNRPTKVCGMVKNVGEPGGGPFWAKNPDGSISLQIVEGSQIDASDPEKQIILQNASHFNPVDLVCAIKNYKGEPFNLLDFRDPQTGFITHKSKDGRELKAQELPGLWNGAMADWNTVFVEVPIVTFNPVKTVNDLLRKEHLGNIQ
ncbi:MAG: DUF4301 family protein [Chitinophagales bacterium]